MRDSQELKARLAALEVRPPLERDGAPAHGARWGRGRVVRVRSRGPGVPVLVRNPLGRMPRRMEPYSAADRAAFSGGRSDPSVFTVTPTDAKKGRLLAMVIE